MRNKAKSLAKQLASKATQANFKALDVKFEKKIKGQNSCFAPSQFTNVHSQKFTGYFIIYIVKLLLQVF